MNKKSKINWPLKLLGFLLDYGLIIVTVFAAFSFSIWMNFLNQPIEPIQQWILLILTGIATTQLFDRFRVMRNLNERINSIEETLQFSNAGKVEMSLDLIPDISERISRAKTVSVCGQGLLVSTLRLDEVYRKRIKNGVQFRFILLDPDNDVLHEVIVASSKQPFSKDNLRADIKRGFDFLVQIFTQTGCREGSGIRFLQTRPTFGMYLLDEGTNQAEAWIWLYGFHAFKGPSFHLLPEQNKTLLDFYQSQFQKMWENSKVGYPTPKEKDL